MEQTPWKPILFAAIASFIMLVLVLFFSQPKHDTSRRVEKILEFDASSIVGRSEGKKVWEFSAVTGWVGNNRDATNLKDVKKGLFYKDGELLIKDFTAHEVAAYKKSKNVEAKTANALIVITGKKGKKKRKFSRISADFFKYNPDNKSSFLSGNIKLVDKKTTLRSDFIEIDHDKGISTLNGNIRIKRKDINLTCDKMRYIADYEEIIAQNNINATIDGKEKTNIKAGYLKMYIDEKKDITASGEVEAIQGKKAAIAKKVVYNKNKKQIELSGKVKTVIEKGRALIKPETAQNLKNNKIKEILKEKTLQDSDILILSTISGDYTAFGNIIVIQKNKEAKAEQADYSDKYETITLSGNVYLKEKERWVKCQKVIVSVKGKALEAVGRVEAEFKL